MSDEEFKQLATLYLEDALSEEGCLRLDQELVKSPDRVREFNDLRLLAGLILEHGHGETPNGLVAFPPRTRRPSLWIAAASITLVGTIIGILGWNSGFRPGSGTTRGISLAVADAGFEKFAIQTENALPTKTGMWIGCGAPASEGKADVSPLEGKQMLCLVPPKKPEPAPGYVPERVTQWQIVDLDEKDFRSGPMKASLVVHFNADEETESSDFPCRVELYSFRGEPASAEVQLKSEMYLSAAITHLEPDADPKSWEPATVNLIVDPKADFLLMGISGTAKKVPDPFGVRFQGHFADGVELTLFNTEP